jgi:hypothetical protein
MVAALVAFGAAPAAAGAATGIYRLVSYWAVLILGWLAWLALRAGEAPVRRARLGLATAIRALGQGFARYPYATLAAVTAASSPPSPEPAEPAVLADRH